MLQSVGSQRVGHDWVTRQQHGVCVCTTRPGASTPQWTADCVPHLLERPPVNGQLGCLHGLGHCGHRGACIVLNHTFVWTYA